MRYGDPISIVMPVYNRAHLLDRVVRTILAQSYTSFELIVVDDASSDDAGAVLDAYGDDRIRLVRRAQNGGAAAARNTGIEAARHDWIAFHDSDDFCTPDRLEFGVRALEGCGPDTIGVYGNLIRYQHVTKAQYTRAGAEILPPPHAPCLSGDMAAGNVVMNIMNLPTITARKTALVEAGMFDEMLRQNEDWDICLRLTRIGKFRFVPEPFVLSPDEVDPVVNSARISQSARQGARSFARITGKLRRQGVQGPALAGHYSTAGRYLMRIGRPRQARRFFGAALAQKRGDVKLWMHWTLSHMPALHARLSRPPRV